MVFHREISGLFVRKSIAEAIGEITIDIIMVL
jgi:hypothetical protein